MLKIFQLKSKLENMEKRKRKKNIEKILIMKQQPTKMAKVFNKNNDNQ